MKQIRQGWNKQRDHTKEVPKQNDSYDKIQREGNQKAGAIVKPKKQSPNWV
jgi:hypothetical protein